MDVRIAMTNLNKKEKRILEFLANGWAFNEIAKKTQLSHRTIGFIVAEIKCKVEKSGGHLRKLIESEK